MSSFVFGYDASYWYGMYLEESRLAQARGRNVRDQEVRLGRQRRTIQSLTEEVKLLKEAFLEAQNGGTDAPVDNDGTSTLEERVNKLERIVGDHSERLEMDDSDISAIFGRVKRLERQVEPVGNSTGHHLTFKGSAALDKQDVVNRGIDRALTRAGRSRDVS